MFIVRVFSLLSPPKLPLANLMYSLQVGPQSVAVIGLISDTGSFLSLPRYVQG